MLFTEKRIIKKKTLKHNITEIGDLILSTYCIYTEMECASKFLMK